MVTKFFEQLSNNLNELLKNSDGYNVIIEVGQAPNNKTFKAHSIILNSRCSYFKDKLDAVIYNDKNVKTIKQSNVSVKVFDIIIKYIYNGIISLEKVDAPIVFELLIASNEFGLEELVNHVQRFLLENHAFWLCLNFSRVYQASLKSNLQQFCKNIIARYPGTVFDSNEFLNISEDILVFILLLDNLQMDEGKIWDNMIKWGIAQNPSLPSNLDQWTDDHFIILKKSLQNCLPLIRYFQMSGEDVFDKVRPYQKILDPTIWADVMLKFMVPNKAITTSQILPPRNLNTTLPSRDGFYVPDDESEIKLNFASELGKNGESHRAINGSKESLTDLNKSLGIEPNNTFMLKNRGYNCLKMNRYEESLVYLTESLKIDPNDTFSLRYRGRTYYLMNRYDESLADLTKSLEINPDDTFALKQRGATYLMMDRYEESLKDLTKSLKIQPNDALALEVRGETYRMMARYKESLADLNKSLEINPNDVFALGNRGVTYRMMGRFKESLVDFNKCLKVSPDDKFAAEQLGITIRCLENLI
ncbi:hypothetical protein C2G38_2042211 [Gigaspora rosea]|uniref:BTB domain-containing protein n=1 Tax=Gigaspora rosea TaxID=44941 RepID=A0A397UP25_9GLOM|nr:hypothetical protein C2G38_2042211 [Gigaspora rosea]